VGYLDELKRQADEARARTSVDLAALERNSLVTDGACNAAFRYLAQPGAAAERAAAGVEGRRTASTRRTPSAT
jgi:hypothetical protein